MVICVNFEHDFYREIKCSECGVVVNDFHENNSFHDDMCDNCWLDDLVEDEESIFETEWYSFL